MSTEPIHHLKKVERKDEYKFPYYVKKDAKARANWVCQECGCEEKECGPLEVHHIIPIYIACNFFPQLSKAMLTSLDNALAVCNSCHTEIHRNIDENLEREVEKLKPLAQSLLGFANTASD